MLTDDFVVTLHKRLFGDVWEWAGSFRRTGKNIGIDPLHISVELRTLMDDARYWAEHATYDPIESAVRLHHRLVFIHPFPNGNGRHARIMADTVLRRIFRLDPIDWAGGHDLQRMNERGLKAADRGDIAPLMMFVGPPQKLSTTVSCSIRRQRQFAALGGTGRSRKDIRGPYKI